MKFTFPSICALLSPRPGTLHPTLESMQTLAQKEKKSLIGNNLSGLCYADIDNEAKCETWNAITLEFVL